MSKQAILLIYAHPDDETVFTGGIIPKYASRGVDIYLVTATRGELGKTSGQCTREQLASIREVELKNVARILGVKKLEFLGYPDKGLSKVNSQEISSRIADIICGLRPQVIITFGPDGATGHEDHKAVHKFAVNAINLAGYGQTFSGNSVPFKVPKVYYIALTLEMREHLGITEPTTCPDTIVDTKYFSTVKMKALQCHKTQEQSLNKFLCINQDVFSKFLGQETFRLAKEYSEIKDTSSVDLFEAIE